MTEDRAKALECLGFIWDTHEETWARRLKELREYKAIHGDCLVPTSYSHNPSLGSWVHHQRRQYKRSKQGLPCHINDERIKSLEDVGFVWNPRTHARSQNHDDVSSVSSEDSSSTDDFATSLGLRPKKRRKL
jgi:hypothetical protein